MPSLEIKSLRNRRRTRSRLHLSSTPTSPLDDPPASNTKPPLYPLTTTTTTGPSSSSSDERPRHNKSPASSISSSSFFDDEQWRDAKSRRHGLHDTVWWGYFLLATTWILFVLAVGGVCGIWEWSLRPLRGSHSRLVCFVMWVELM